MTKYNNKKTNKLFCYIQHVRIMEDFPWSKIFEWVFRFNKMWKMFHLVILILLQLIKKKVLLVV